MHFCVVKSRTIKIVFALALIVALVAIPFGGSSAAAVFFGYNFKKVPIYSVQTDAKQIAISFDAAWGADKTEGILEILNEFGVSATFFLVGFWVDDYPEMVQKIADAGIEIGAHSNTHPDMSKLDAVAMKAELETCVSKITNITGREVNLFRPPFGAYNNTLLDTAESLGLKTIQWSVDSLDWKGLSAAEITNRVVSGAKNGSIVLMHNNSDHILEALRLILTRLTVAGYSITSVGELVYGNDYTIDRNGVQQKK